MFASNFFLTILFLRIGHQLIRVVLQTKLSTFLGLHSEIILAPLVLAALNVLKQMPFKIKMVCAWSQPRVVVVIVLFETSQLNPVKSVRTASV